MVSIGGTGAENGPRDPATVRVYVSVVAASDTGRLLQALFTTLPSEDLGHLKRVQRGARHGENNVLLCSAALWDAEMKKSETGDSIQHSLVEAFNLVPTVVELPGVPPLTRDEVTAWATRFRWQLVYKPGRMQLPAAPSPRDLLAVHGHLSHLAVLRRTVFDNVNHTHVPNIAMLVDPITNTVLTWDMDRSNRRAVENTVNHIDALSHAVMNCIEKFSRAVCEDKEKRKTNALAGKRGLSASDADYENQYLCTGLDVYVNREPCIMCAMALVHSRIRRVIYTEANEDEVGGLSVGRVNCEPLINHKYEAYYIPLTDFS